MENINLTLLTWLIPLPPLLAFAVIVLFLGKRDRALAHFTAIGAAIISLVLSLIVVFSVLPEGGKHLGQDPIQAFFAWLPTGDTTLNIGVLVDPLTAVMLTFVPIAILMIMIYSVGYSNYILPEDSHDRPGLPPHGVDPMYTRFFAFLSLFAGAMLVLVVADNLLLLFIGWEVMGLCSYLLIGFWYARNYKDPNKVTPRVAAIKAFMTTRVADVVMLLGIAYLYSVTGTLNFREILFDTEVLEHLGTMPSVLGAGLTASNLIGLLLFTGTVGKSAQFPLHTWLPDAMEGPTPVSAMIHAAAMVSAGVYAVIRMYPLYSAGGIHEGHLEPTLVMNVMTAIGAFTALFAATIALAQFDVKKVLAYSTISQLGFMIAAVGIGGYIAATFHLMTHAFFKALLFMASGSVIHGVEHGHLHAAHHSGHGGGGHDDNHGHGHDDHDDHDDHGDDFDPQDMRNMGGLMTRMPWTFWTFLIGGLALAGFPFITAGFWSKDEILADAWVEGHYVVFGVLVLAAFMTAFYTMRQISMTFLGKPRTEAAEYASENHWTMTLPLVILSFFALFAGFLGVNPNVPVIGNILGSNFMKDWVKYTLPSIYEFETFTLAQFGPAMLASIIVALGGLGLGWLVYGRKPLEAGQEDPMRNGLGPVFGILENKYYIDELYDAVFVKPSAWFSRVVVYEVIDQRILNGVLHFIAWAAERLGKIFFNFFEEPVITKGADAGAESVRWFGHEFRVIQTGKVQQYLIVSVFIAILLLVVIVALNVPTPTA